MLKKLIILFKLGRKVAKSDILNIVSKFHTKSKSLQIVNVADFNDLDIDFLEGQDLAAEAEQELQFTELDINFLDVDFLRDLLEVIEEADALGDREEATAGDRLVDRAFGLQPDNQFNIIPDVDGKVFFLRQGTNYVSLKIKRGNSGQIEVSDKDLGDTIMCLNECEGIFISITQE